MISRSGNLPLADGRPDLAVAAVMAMIFLTSSVQILRQAWAEYREAALRSPSAAHARLSRSGPCAAA